MPSLSSPLKPPNSSLRSPSLRIRLWLDRSRRSPGGLPRRWRRLSNPRATVSATRKPAGKIASQFRAQISSLESRRQRRRKLWPAPPAIFERSAAAPQVEASPEFERPIPAGLPADITPEEIAAITAAAASYDGKAGHPTVIPEGSASESVAAMQAASAEITAQSSEPDAPATLASATESEQPTPVEVSAEATPVGLKPFPSRLPAAKTREWKKTRPRLDYQRLGLRLIRRLEQNLEHRFPRSKNLPRAMPRSWLRSLPWPLPMAIAAKARQQSQPHTRFPPLRVPSWLPPRLASPDPGGSRSRLR